MTKKEYHRTRAIIIALIVAVIIMIVFETMMKNFDAICGYFSMACALFLALNFHHRSYVAESYFDQTYHELVSIYANMLAAKICEQNAVIESMAKDLKPGGIVNFDKGIKLDPDGEMILSKEQLEKLHKDLCGDNKPTQEQS